MERQNLILAALASAGPGVMFTPAQVQKLFFLIDEEVPEDIGGPCFAFVPYDFGPFDAAVYHEIRALQEVGLADIGQSGRYRTYGLTSVGFQRGQEELQQTSRRAQDFIGRAARWVRSVSFEQLVAAIYQKYPAMKARSIFRNS